MRAENGVLRRRAETLAEAAAAEKRLAAGIAAQRDALQQVALLIPSYTHRRVAPVLLQLDSCVSGLTTPCMSQLAGCLQVSVAAVVQQDLQRLAAEAVAAADSRRADGDTAATADSALADLRARL